MTKSQLRSMTSDKPVDEVKSKSVDAVSNDHGSSKPKPAPRSSNVDFGDISTSRVSALLIVIEWQGPLTLNLTELLKQQRQLVLCGNRQLSNGQLANLIC